MEPEPLKGEGIASGVAPGPPFEDFRSHFGLHFGAVFDAFRPPVDLVIFATPPVRKLDFRGSGGSRFGTFSGTVSEVAFRGVLGTVSDRLRCPLGLRSGARRLPLQAPFRNPFFDGFRGPRGGGQGEQSIAGD